LFDQKNIADAIREAQRVIEQDPTDAAAHGLLGRSYAVQDRLTDARRSLERAIQLDPSNEGLADDLRKLQALAGDR
jgi:cytochrome c-type biogenesis protein CcmH/NrfG